MELPASAVTLAPGARPVSAVDPHLLVLGLLVAAWVIDRVLAAVERFGGGGDDAGESPGPPVGTDESRGDAGRPSGTE